MEMNETIHMVKSDSDDYSEDSGLENYAEEDKNLKKDIM
jgi:hypothetical protein